MSPGPDAGTSAANADATAAASAGSEGGAATGNTTEDAKVNATQSDDQDATGQDAPNVLGRDASSPSDGAAALSADSAAGANDAMRDSSDEPSGDAGSPPFRCDPTPDADADVSLPGPYTAAPETVRGAGVPAGTILPSPTQIASYKSAIYGYSFQYQIYVPAEYDGKTPAALMVFHDGLSLYRGILPTMYNVGGQAKFFADVVLDNLIHAGDVPVAIGLFIEPTAARSVEYDTPDDKFPRFLVEEIIPDEILSKYAIVRDPQAWASIGWSSGGTVSFKTIWYENSFFQKMIGANASFANAIELGTNYIDVVTSSPAEPVRMALLSGPNDAANGGGNWRMLNMQMTAAERAKGNAVRYVDGTGQHYPPLEAAADFPNALRWLWQGCH